MMRNVNGATYIRENLQSRIDRGSLTPEQVATELNFQGEGIQDSLDIWNGTADTSLTTGSVTDFLDQRIASKGASVREEANDASREDAPFALRWIHSQMEAGSAESTRRRAASGPNTLEEYGQLVTETTSTLHALQGLRDPANRAALRPDQIRELPRMVQRVEENAPQARAFLAQLQEQGVDTAALEGLLREQLDKFDAGYLLEDAPEWDNATMVRANRAGQAFSQAQNAGQPATKEAVDYVKGARDLLNESPTPFLHRSLAPAVERLVQQQIAVNDGRVPDGLREVLQDPTFQRFGAFSPVLSRLDIEDLMANDVDLREATNGRYVEVEWQPPPAVVDEALISDDRPEGTDNVEADIAWRDGLAQITPNVSAALNSMFASYGGGIHRVATDITEANHPEAEAWRAEGWNRVGGSDVRTPDQVEGVYTKTGNIAVMADSRVVADTGTGSNVIVHELGHALDSMLGETLSEGAWFTDYDTEFRAFHTAIKDTASYGRSPEQSLMHWYFRNADEGAAKHNGSNGHKEVFAEGYAAYAAGLQRLEEMAQTRSGPISEETAYVLIGRQLTGERGKLAEWAGELTFEQVREREGAIGHAIMDYFGDLETNRLPKIMADPKAMAVRSGLRNAVVDVELGAPAAPQQRIATPAQKAKVETHNSVKHGRHEMVHIAPGTPEWDAQMAEIKRVSPGAALPPANALHVTFNPHFAEQGAAIIWKAVIPNKVDWSGEYTDEHKATQLAAKFQRQKRVDQGLNETHAKAETEALYDETAALVLAMLETGMRVGSSEKAGSKDKKTGKTIKTFGGATMLKKHVFFPSDTLMRFKFPGKSGKENVYESRNPALRAAVIQLLEGKGPSDQVFAGTNSGRSIDYIRQATGIDDVINHDTRTRYATNMARDLVAKWPKSKLPKNEAAATKAKAEVAKKVGLAINDTWTVARDSYISPAVWRRFEESAGIPYEFEDSPPYGLVEGETVTSMVPGTPGGPVVPTPGAPGAPVAAAAEPPPPAVEEEVEEPMEQDDEPESWTLDHSAEAVAEREGWYAQFVWPDPPIVAGPDPAFVNDVPDEDPEPEPVEPEEAE